MEEYRIDMRIRNNLILTKIEEAGYPSAMSFCKATGVSYGRLIDFISMRRPIYNKYGQINKSIEKLCKELNCLPEEIFSASQMEASLKTNKRTLKVNEAEAIFMLSQSDSQKMLEDHYSDDQMSNAVDKALATLTPRETKVIQMRMGLGDYSHEHTLLEVAEAFDVTRERVRQIEAKALRKMRHPDRADKLKEFINNKD